MGYSNGTRYNHRQKKKKHVWTREADGDGDGKGAGEGEQPSTSEGAKAPEAAGAAAGPGPGLSSKAAPFVATRKRGREDSELSARAKPFVATGSAKGQLEELERKKRELQEKIREKKRKLAEDEIFRQKQQALRDAAKHSQEVAERRAKIARLQGGFDKVKQHLVDTNQAPAGGPGAVAGAGAGSSLKPSSKLKEVTREDVVRVLHALNDYDVLQVNLASGSSEVRKNFLKLSRAFHPDKCRVEGSKEAFQRVSKAYQNLKKLMA